MLGLSDYDAVVWGRERNVHRIPVLSLCQSSACICDCDCHHPFDGAAAARGSTLQVLIHIAKVCSITHWNVELCIYDAHVDHSNVMSSWFQYEALKYVSFPTQVLAKASKVIPVMLMGKVVQGKT